MTAKPEQPGRTRFFRLKRVARLTAPLILLGALVWLAAWLVQRAYNSPNRQRQFQDWLDENLNADVSQLGSLRLRLNLVRNTRLYVNNLEIEHPNPLFPGKFVTLREVIARVPSYSLYGLTSGKVSLVFWQLKTLFEQNAMGEWNTDGLMRPLSRRMVDFPFPAPSLSGFVAELRESELVVRRRGYEMKFTLDLEMECGKDGRRLVVHAPRIPFVFTHIDSGKTFSGALGAESASALFAFNPDGTFSFSPENCEFRLDNFPVAALPFFFSSLPEEALPGTLAGLLRVADDGRGGMWATLEGEIRDVPLTLFGLPRKAPIKVRIPLGAGREERAASVRLGPSGYGGFDLRIPIDEQGVLKGLEMQGDVVSIEDLAAIFSSGGGWAEWLSTVLPSIRWRAGKWMGYGWEGENFRLSLSRSTGGMNLLGEADMMGGQAKMAVNPGKELPLRVTVAAKNLDGRALAAKLSKLVPDPWAASLTGGRASLTWRGALAPPGEKGEWNFGFVLSKPEIDVAASGEWWRKLFALPGVIADALPAWGGGDEASLREAMNPARFGFDQLSIVSVSDEDTGVRVEFVAQGPEGGEAGGWVEKTGEGGARGELFIVGSARIVDAARKANPELGKVLGMLSGTPEGLHVSFTYLPDRGLEFTYPFLQDAQRIRGELERLNGKGEGE